MTINGKKVIGMSRVCIEETERYTKFQKVVNVRWREKIIYIKKSFLDSASIFGSEDFYDLQEILSSYPDYKRYIIDDHAC